MGHGYGPWQVWRAQRALALLLELAVAALAAGLVVLAATLLLPGAAQARMLDPIGPLRPVAEPDLLELISGRLGQLERSGQLAVLQQRLLADTREAAVHPAPVAGLVTASEPHTSYLDPSVVLAQDIADGGGRLLFARGTRVNPLDALSWPGQLLFFDARDRRQLELAQRLLASGQAGIKPVLVGGSALELSRQWQRQVYYDQQGALVRRLQIHQVPALVRQEGRRLRIDAYGVTP